MKSRNRIKHISFCSSLILIVCIVLFCILEIFLRVYTAPFVVKIKGEEIVLPREGKDWAFTHNFTTDKLDKLVTVKQNHLGFRGSASPENFSEHLTIMTVGGSTTYNAYISEGKTWTDVLGQKLQKVFKNLWINNAGFDGHTTRGHISLLEKHITKLKPKILLFLVGLNDSIDDDKIAIEVEKHSYKARQKKIKANRLNREEQEVLEKKTMKYKIVKFLKKTGKEMSKYSEVFSTAITVIRNIEARKKGKVYTVKQNDYKTIEISEEDRKTLQNLLQSNDVKEHLISYEARVKKLIKLSRDNNIEPVIVTYPVLYGDAIDDVTKVNLARIRIHNEHWISDGEQYWAWDQLVNDVNRKVATDEGLLLIELSKKMPKSSKYYIDFIHYSNRGNEVVADIIYNTLCPYLAENYSEYLMNDCDSI